MAQKQLEELDRVRRLSSTVSEQIEQAKAIIFDCDGTLVNSAPLYSKAWAAGFLTSGKAMPAGWYETRTGLSEHVLMDHFEQDHGVTLDRERVIQVMRQKYLDTLDDFLEEIDAVTYIAKHFSGKMPMAVASGGSRPIVHRSLVALKLDGLFDAIVTFEDVDDPKPAPDLFLEAARQLGQEPQDCLVFEDSPQGLEAARRAGMPVIDVASL